MMETRISLNRPMMSIHALLALLFALFFTKHVAGMHVFVGDVGGRMDRCTFGHAIVCVVCVCVCVFVYVCVWECDGCLHL